MRKLRGCRCRLGSTVGTAKAAGEISEKKNTCSRPRRAIGGLQALHVVGHLPARQYVAVATR